MEGVLASAGQPGLWWGEDGLKCLLRVIYTIQVFAGEMLAQRVGAAMALALQMGILPFITIQEPQKLFLERYWPRAACLLRCSPWRAKERLSPPRTAGLQEGGCDCPGGSVLSH